MNTTGNELLLPNWQISKLPRLANWQITKITKLARLLMMGR